jgi:hypothetical protein
VRAANSLLGLAAVAICFGLSGCVEPGEPASPPAKVVTDVDVGKVGPGSAIPSIDQSSALFDRVCLKTNAEWKQMQRALTSIPVRLNPVSKIYYHRTLNLSFKRVVFEGKPSCSMVTAVKEPDAMALGLGFLAQGVTGSVSVATRTYSGLDGVLYANAVAMME